MDISVMSLNIMHARRRGKTSLPLGLKKQHLAKNVADIVAAIKHQEPDLVALQEVDGPSFLNGGTDQFREIWEQSGYPYAYFGIHSRIGRALHVAGTAILSRHPLENSRTEYFSRTFPIPRKGYAVSDVILPNGRRVTFVSAHFVVFDVRLKSARIAQSQLMVRNLSSGEHPLIIAGDFNCEAKEMTIGNMVEELKLHVFEPHSRGLMTFPAWKPKRRIDWVLPSRHFRFVEYAVHTDVSTDHAGVSARLMLI